MDFKEISKVTKGVSRSICAENPTGDKGQGGRAVVGMGLAASNGLGRGYKISPCLLIKAHSKAVLADIIGAGCINHIWMTSVVEANRGLILKMRWDNEEKFSVQCPVGPFFCQGYRARAYLSSLMVTANPAGGFNAYWPMPFRKRAVIEVENVLDSDLVLYFQIDYELRPVQEDEGFFHANYQVSKPVKKGANHLLLATLKGAGQYVGTFLSFKTDFVTWWGEGEFKFFIDGDTRFPTICGTGTEDYFGGAWNFEDPAKHYRTFSTPYQGLVEVDPADQSYIPDQKFSMYRWHLMDPVRFQQDLRVEVQAIGWEEGNLHYRLLQPEIRSVSFWYQVQPQPVQEIKKEDLQ
jgi:hypothetical protein